MREDLLKGFSDEQIEKINQCHSGEELLALAKQEGVELTNEQLEAVSGGACEPDGKASNPIKCPMCGYTNTKFVSHNDIGRMVWDVYYCLTCKREYRVVLGGY